MAMITERSPPAISDQLVYKLEKAIKMPLKLDYKICRVIEKRQLPNREEAKQLCLKRLQTHADDVVYLVQKGTSLKKILTIFCKSEVRYAKRWRHQLHLETRILKAHNPSLSSVQQPISKQYVCWLKEMTTYNSILETIKRPNRIPLEISQLIDKELLKRLFLTVAKIQRNTAAIYQKDPSGITANLLAYKGRTGIFNLLFFEGSKPLHTGSHGEVFKVYDVAAERRLAFKRYFEPLQRINNDFYIWSKIKGGHPGLLSPPEIAETDFIVNKMYDGDLVDLLNILQYNAQITVREILLAFQNAMKGLHFLNSQEIAHLDIKAENLFFNMTNKKLLFVVGDLGTAQIYDEIINKNILGFYHPNLKNKQDETVYKLLRETNRKKIKMLLEKREVYAYGKMLFLFLLGRPTLSPATLGEVHKDFRNIYGKALHAVCKKLCLQNYKKRLSFDQALEYFEKILQVEDPNLDKAIHYNFNHFETILPYSEPEI